MELEGILETVEETEDFAGLDLLALQEASVHDGQEDAAAIAARLGRDYRHLQVETHVLQGHVQANALVWNSRRVRILESAALRLPGRADGHLSRTERTLLSVLPVQQRMALVFDCWIRGQAIRLYVAHLDVLGYQHKLQQFNRILEDLTTRDEADITILAGDLNTFKM